MAMPIHSISKLTGVSDYKLWHLLERYVNTARNSEDLSYLHSVGMDETSVAKGHDYITLFVDLQNKKTVYVADGKGSKTVKDFAHEIQKHNGNPQQIKQVSCDMSPAFIKGVGENLSYAEITFDKFHITKLINESVDKVRKEEAQNNPILKGARYALLKNVANMTIKQKNIRENLQLSKLNLKSIRAMNIRETFQQLYQSTSMEVFKSRLQSWYFWATHSRLNPIIKVAKTIKKHWNGILQWEKSKLNNGLLEGLNSVIQAAKRKARSYKKPHFKIIAYLLTGKLNLTQVNKCLPT
jgi:transposase